MFTGKQKKAILRSLYRCNNKSNHNGVEEMMNAHQDVSEKNHQKEKGNLEEKTKGYLLPLPDITDFNGATKSVTSISNKQLNPKSRKGKNAMQFTTTSKELSEVLVNMNRVINSKNVLPILADIIFIVKNSNLTLKVSDGEVTLQADVTITDVEGEGTFAVNAKDIMEGVKGLPEIPLTFSINEGDNSVKVDYFSGIFTLPTDKSDKFPTTPDMQQDEVRTTAINEGLLQENIARTVFATSQDELRPVMNGIFFNLTTEHLAVVASDGHQLVRNTIDSIKAEDDNHKGSFILPKKPAHILKNILRKGTEDGVMLTFDGRQVRITAQRFTMTCRLIEGRYPNYNSVIPKSNPNIVMVDRNTLIAALKRVVPFSNSSSQLVKMHVENGTIQLDTEDYDFSKTATERMTCEYNGTAMSIGFKGTSLVEILSNINSTEIEIQLADPSRAALLMPAEQPQDMNILMLQMPMLLND